MKVRTSIPFNSLSGMAGDVVARETRFGMVLSGRPRRPRTASPSQKQARAIFYRVGHRYRTLTAGQVEAWARFAPQMEAGLAPVNAFMRLSFMRSLLGLQICALPPASVVQVPALVYRSVFITPTEVLFSGIVRIADRYRLTVRMSKAVSSGVSYGNNMPVIIDSGLIPDFGMADVTRIYTEKLGVTPLVGQKYFIEMYWVDSETGFTGPHTNVCKVCIPD